MSEISIVGAGSVGTFFAAHLAALGHDIVACVRRPFEEYCVDSATSPITVPSVSVTDPSQITAPSTWVFVAVKAHQTEGAAEWFDVLCGESTKVVVMQNGVEGVERLTPYVHGAEIIPTVVYCGSELLEPGHIRHSNNGYLIVADTPSAHALASLFDGSPATITISNDFVTDEWRKLGINTVANGITALTSRRLEVLAAPGMNAIARRILQEGWAVGRALGADLTDEQAEQLLGYLTTTRSDGGTSMLWDRLAGRSTEHDALYGAVVRRGAALGIPTPTNETILALLAATSPT